VEQIAREANIIRTTTYTQIESLIAQGLMSSYTVNKKTYYAPETPANLGKMLLERKQAISEGENVFDTVLPDLIGLYTKSDQHPVIRFFPGKEGIISMRNEVLAMSDKELCVITAFDDFRNVFDESERNAFTKKRLARKITTRILYTSEQPDNPNAAKQYEGRKLPQDEFPIHFDIYLFDNRVCISSLKNDVWGIMIESPAIKASMQSLFDMVWKLLTPPK
jgi:sugar-specific transcriptional regulator TrmB